MSALRENICSNFAYVKNLEVADNTGASKTVSFASTISEIDLTVQDATPVPVTSSAPMRNKEKTAIDIDETKNSDTQRNFYKYIPSKLKIYAMKGTIHWRKLRNLNKHLSYENLKENHAKSKYYTGTNVEVFDFLFDYLQAEKDNEPVKNTRKGRHRLLSYRDQLIMTLIKLKRNTQFENLADQVGCSKTTAQNIFRSWINLMHANLKFLIKWPGHDASMQTLPNVFRQYFPKLTAIIDCSEIFIDRAKTYKAKAQVYSNYKKHSTVKFLIACSILFISRACGGRVSDIDIVKESGLINPNLHHHGDQILADRGFTLQDEFAVGCGVELIFTKGKMQLSAKEVEVSRQIASVRIHVERVIGLIKNRYNILDCVLPLALLKTLSEEGVECEIANIDKLFTVCAVLVNLGEGIVYNEKVNSQD